VHWGLKETSERRRWSIGNLLGRREGRREGRKEEEGRKK